jgi:hypothetical protein
LPAIAVEAPPRPNPCRSWAPTSSSESDPAAASGPSSPARGWQPELARQGAAAGARPPWARQGICTTRSRTGSGGLAWEVGRFSPTEILPFLRASVRGRTSFPAEETVSSFLLLFLH